MLKLQVELSFSQTSVSFVIYPADVSLEKTKNVLTKRHTPVKHNPKCDFFHQLQNKLKLTIQFFK